MTIVVMLIVVRLNVNAPSVELFHQGFEQHFILKEFFPLFSKN
jgi:hypothetical protein